MNRSKEKAISEEVVFWDPNTQSGRRQPFKVLSLTSWLHLVLLCFASAEEEERNCWASVWPSCYSIQHSETPVWIYCVWVVGSGWIPAPSFLHMPCQQDTHVYNTTMSSYLHSFSLPLSLTLVFSLSKSYKWLGWIMKIDILKLSVHTFRFWVQAHKNTEEERRVQQRRAWTAQSNREKYGNHTSVCPKITSDMVPPVGPEICDGPELSPLFCEPKSIKLREQMPSTAFLVLCQVPLSEARIYSSGA